MNAIAEKMKLKGVLPRDVRLNIAIAEFMNNGGSETRALALVRSAYERARQGQGPFADKASCPLPTRAHRMMMEGQRHPADRSGAPRQPSSPNDDTGHTRHAVKAKRLVPASSPNGSGRPSEDCRQGHVLSANSFHPTGEPKCRLTRQ